MPEVMDPFPPPDTEPFGPPCPGCGRGRTAGDAAGLAWSSRHTVGSGRTVVEFVCPACTRADLGQIETGLPTARRSSAA